MIDGEFQEAKVYEIDGTAIRVQSFISEDQREVEYHIEGSMVLTPLEVAKILEQCCSQIMRDIKVPPPIYAKELN